MFSRYLETYIFSIHRTCAINLHSSAPLGAEGKTMRKIMGLSSKKKNNKYFNEPILPTPKHFAVGAAEGKKSVNSKRISVLNKLFMRNITDLMATGESSNILQAYNIEINRVQISPDFNNVNVFWLATSSESDQVVEKLLLSQAGPLRHDLSQLRVMGVVPRINFVKDKKYAQIREVDLRLTKADFGEDYVPNETLTRLKTELQLHTSLDSHTRKKIQELDETCNEEELQELDIPDMTQNVFGINHKDIMERLVKGLKKSKAQHRLSNVIDEENIKTYNADKLSTNIQPFSFGSARKQRDAFKEFLVKRQLLKLKGDKEKNFRPESEYLQEEWEVYTKNIEDAKISHYFKDVDFEDEMYDYEKDEIK